MAYYAIYWRLKYEVPDPHIGHGSVAILFEATDPRGITIQCLEERWNAHILVRHGFLRGREAEVKQALESPHYICSDADFPTRQIYYFLRKDHPRYLKVVIEFGSDDTTARLVTAFLADGGKAGEQVIWLASQS